MAILSVLINRVYNPKFVLRQPSGTSLHIIFISFTSPKDPHHIFFFFFFFNNDIRTRRSCPKWCNLSSSRGTREKKRFQGMDRSWRYLWMQVLKDWRLYVAVNGHRKGVLVSRSHRDKRIGKYVCSVSIQFTYAYS